MLKFIRVSKNYNEDKPALNEVSFDIDSGELVLITGPSGSGKTTLLKLITKEQDPSDGEIYFKEENVGLLKRSKVPFHRRRIGAVFQDYKLLPELNIWENIALALSILGHPEHEIEEKVTDLLKLVDLTDKAYLFPHQLSGGEAQRISIARALSTAPELIFADEPTGNLDADNSRIIAKLLKKINDLGTTVIVTTHDPVVIKTLSDARTMSLDKGVLTDSKDDKKRSTKKEENDKDSSKEEKDDVKEPKEDTKKSKKKDDYPVKEEKSEKKSGFNLFAFFGKKKKSDDELEKKDDEDKDLEEDKKNSTKKEEKPEESDKPKESVEPLDEETKKDTKKKKKDK